MDELDKIEKAKKYPTPDFINQNISEQLVHTPTYNQRKIQILNEIAETKRQMAQKKSKEIRQD